MISRFAKRKWGWYLTLIDRGNFKVKLLRFHRNKSCSMQYHALRNELWLFLSGEGKMSYDMNIDWVKGGDYRVVPVFSWHTYFAMLPTYVLEIQYGESCEEKDIVRV